MVSGYHGWMVLVLNFFLPVQVRSHSPVSPICCLLNKSYFSLFCPLQSLNLTTCSFPWSPIDDCAPFFASSLDTPLIPYNPEWMRNSCYHLSGFLQLCPWRNLICCSDWYRMHVISTHRSLCSCCTFHVRLSSLFIEEIITRSGEEKWSRNLRH